MLASRPAISSATEQRGGAFGVEKPLAELRMRRRDHAVAGPRRSTGRGASPCDDHTRRNQSVGSTCTVASSGPRFSTVIWMRTSSGGRLGVLHEHVEVTGLVKHPRVEQLVLGLPTAPPPVGLDQVARTDRPPGDTCTGTSCTSGSASSRGRSSTPSRPRRGSPRCWSARRAAPSGWGDWLISPHWMVASLPQRSPLPARRPARPSGKPCSRAPPGPRRRRRSRRSPRRTCRSCPGTR